MSENRKPETIRFNVGGKEYEASRSLFEQKQHESTLLARMISDTWLTGPNAVLFIDRDGENFRHVLHYLRYGTVSLPMGGSTSKASLLLDMDFYGIEVPEGSVDAYIPNVNAYHRMMEEVKKDVRSEMKSLSDQKKCLAELRQSLDEQEKTLINQEDCLLVAYECFKSYAQTNRLEVDAGPFMRKHSRLSRGLFQCQIVQSCVVTPTFNECLVRYGLRFLEFDYDSDTITLELLDDEDKDKNNLSH